MSEQEVREPEAQQRSSNREHFHCYLLRSQDPKHPYKTYVGCTVDPHRRLLQHNGIRKHGGAWRTKRSGRPWEFVAIVEGFESHRMALQFEWAWQHCNRSLLVRGVLGDAGAQTLHKRQRIRGQLYKLKTLLLQCPELFSYRQLRLFLFREEWKDMYEKIPVAPSESSDMSSWATTQQVSSLEELPFFATRNQRPKRSRNPRDVSAGDVFTRDSSVDDTDREVSVDCMWCHRPVVDTAGATQNPYISCDSCGRRMHKMCADLYFDSGNPNCPSCNSFLPSYLSDDELEEAGDDSILSPMSCSTVDEEDHHIPLQPTTLVFDTSKAATPEDPNSSADISTTTSNEDMSSPVGRRTRAEPTGATNTPHTELVTRSPKVAISRRVACTIWSDSDSDDSFLLNLSARPAKSQPEIIDICSP